MSVSGQLLDQVEPHAHLLQLYQSDQQHLTRNVAQYLAEGLSRGDGILVIATPEHSDSFLRRLSFLGADPYQAIGERRLLILDASSTLNEIMVEGQPDLARFAATIGEPLRELRARFSPSGLRAYGELVGVLWKNQQFSAAIRMEELWNDLLKSVGFQLYCAYPIDVFSEEFRNSDVERVLKAHTHVMCAGKNGDLDGAIDWAIDELLGNKAAEMRVRLHTNGLGSPLRLPRGESMILGLKETAPDLADEVLSRARRFYQSEKRFRALIENSSDAICLIDALGKVLYASASTAKILGYEPEELLGRPGFELIYPEDMGEVRQALRQVLSQPRCPVQAQARLRRKDGTWCWVESTSTNLLGEPDIRAIVLNYRDISERKASEEEKQRYLEELARSNEELQAFAYAATHDLKEPLRSVCAFTQLLVQRADLDGECKQYSEFIVDGVKRMSALLDDLLAFAGVTFNDATRRVELREAAEKAVQNLDQAIKESGATVTIGNLPAVQGIETHLVQVFQNLIGNSIKYRSDDPLEIHVTATQRGRERVINVNDNGVGIPREYRDRVFGLFKRLHAREVPGNGIGLAICKKVVEGMGGRIWVESEEGKGSAFRFTVRPLEA